MTSASGVTQDLTVIVGLGATGLSCAHFLKNRQRPFALLDTRSAPPQLEKVRYAFPDVDISLGQLDAPILQQANQIVLSPGIAMREPAIQACVQRGASIVGDIELFAREVTKPVIAITGTNAKSTVTVLVGEMAKAAGLNVMVGGNLGVPVLDMLAEHDQTDLYVLELSSFQLETTHSLRANVATVLNISPDHMDRYDTLDDYAAAKQRIYTHCDSAVVNKDDNLTHANAARTTAFTLGAPQDGEFGLLEKEGSVFLALGETCLLNVKELLIPGKHFQANALAALAIGQAYGLPMTAMLATLKTFKGLPHRCQLVRERHDVQWFNDSKGTNVGATRAAIDGLGPDLPGKIVLIAGGLGKNADFTPLMPAFERYVKHVVLIGEAADELAAMCDGKIRYSKANDMQSAIARCDELAVSGDAVLLSPACASFDMFKSFAERGDVFTEIVKALA